MDDVVLVGDEVGLEKVIEWLKGHLDTPSDQRRSIIDAHAPYVGQPHSHDHDHDHNHVHSHN